MKPKTVRNSAAKNTSKPAVVVDRPVIAKPVATLPVPSALPKPPAPLAVVPPPAKPVAPLAKPVMPPVKSVTPPASPVASPVKSVTPAVQAAAPVVKPAASAAQPPLPKATITTVTAKIDVGFGNALYIRGQGNGLSWDKGTLLQCVDPSTWVWSTPNARGEVVFKLLVNDEVWSQGEDLVVAPGRQVEVVPAF